MKRTDAVVMYAASADDANMFYATKFWAPDPFPYVRANGRSAVLVNDLEYGRACKQARVDRVLSVSALSKGRAVPVERLIREQLGTRRRARVPPTFPLEMAERLRKVGVRVEPGATPFFPERMVKTAEEVGAIERVQRVVEAALETVIGILRRAKVRAGRLVHKGGTLTSEGIRTILHQEMMAGGCLGRQTIVAGGNQATDPHQIGTGPLKANQAIVLDIFPRSESTGYYADMTRTVVKGKASPALKRLYAAVLAAQERGIASIRAGADGKAVHKEVQQELVDWGYKTEARKGHWVGFFHGTGHGVGLDIHEPPSVGVRGTPLPEGTVVTVEPGLYYPGVGGIRLEDMVLVEKKGCRNLTRAPKFMEL